MCISHLGIFKLAASQHLISQIASIEKIKDFQMNNVKRKINNCNQVLLFFYFVKITIFKIA